MIYTKKSTINQKYNNRGTEKLGIRSTFVLVSTNYYGRSCAIVVSPLSSIFIHERKQFQNFVFQKIAKLIKFYGKKLYCENLVGNGIENITASS